MYYLQVILFDLGSTYWRLNQWRTEFWELCQIGIPDEDKESRDAIVFGFLTYWFISEVRPYLNARDQDYKTAALLMLTFILMLYVQSSTK